MGTKDKISESLGIDYEEDPVDTLESSVTDLAKTTQNSIAKTKELFDSSGVNSEELATDYQYARTNYYELIEKGKDALEGILDLAQDSQQPRAYEVAALVIKTITDANKEIMSLQKSIQDINLESGNIKNQTNNINNAVFVGSTKELLSAIKDIKEGESAEVDVTPNGDKS